MALMAYYRLGFNDPTAHSILDTLGQFITNYRVTRHLITYIHSVFGAGNLWKRFPRRTLTPLFLSDLGKHNQNLFELAIQGIKFGISTISNACGKGVMAYEYDMR